MTDQHNQTPAEIGIVKAQHAQREVSLSSSVASLKGRLSAEHREHETALASLTQQMQRSEQRFASELRSVKHELLDSEAQQQQSEADVANTRAAQEGLHQDALSEAKQQLQLLRSKTPRRSQT